MISTMGTTALNIDSIEIIESLRPGDLETARHLHEHLLDIRSAEKDPRWNVARHSVKTASELIAVLAECRSRASEDQLYPLIHLECHGSEDVVQLASGECISWLELSQPLRNLNKATRNNLITVWAACNGFHSIKSIVGGIVQGASMRLVIGPAEEVAEDKLENSMKELYSELIASNDIDAALQRAAKIEPSMCLHKAEDGFTAACIEMLRIEASSKRTEQDEVESWVLKAKQLPGLESVPGMGTIVEQTLK